MKCSLKLALFLAGTTLSVGLLSAVLAGRIVRLSLDGEIEDKGLALARVSAELLLPKVIDREALSARASLQEIVQRNVGTRYAFIAGFDGKILAQTFEGGFPRGLAAGTLGHSPASVPTFKRYRTAQGEEILQVFQPLIPGMPAFIALGLDLRQVRSHVAAVQRQILGGTLVVIVFGFLVSLFLGLRITRQIRDLAGALNSFGSGSKEDPFVLRRGCVEIVELAAAFNRMIVDRRQARDALRESEAHYRGIFENSPIALLELDLSHVARALQRLGDRGVDDFAAFFAGHPEEVQKCVSLARILDVNQAAVGLYRAGTKEELRRLPERAPTPAELAVFQTGLLTLARGKITWSFENSLSALDGTELSVFQQWLVMPGHEKDYSRVLVSIGDLTSQRRAEEYVRTILHTIDEGFITVDRELRILSANRAFLESVGRSEAQVLGKKCHEIARHPRQHCSGEGEDCPVRKVLATGLAQRCVHTHLGPGGEESLLSIKAYPLRDAAGKIVTVVETFTDCTGRKLPGG